MVGEKDEHVSFLVCNQQTDCLDKQLKGLFSWRLGARLGKLRLEVNRGKVLCGHIREHKNTYREHTSCCLYFFASYFLLLFLLLLVYVIVVKERVAGKQKTCLMIDGLAYFYFSHTFFPFVREGNQRFWLAFVHFLFKSEKNKNFDGWKLHLLPHVSFFGRAKFARLQARPSSIVW